jgi:hypothetical protein
MSDKILNRVQGLLAKADSTDSPQEAEALRNKASELMVKYAIEEEALIVAQGNVKGSTSAIVSQDLWVQGAFRSALEAMLYALCEAHDAKVRFIGYGKHPDNGLFAGRFVLVGYENELTFIVALYTSLYLDFASKLEPKYTGNADADAWALREAGTKWDRMVYLMRQWYPGTLPEDTWEKGNRAARDWLTRAYRRQCKALGVEPMRTQNSQTYAIDFADSYASAVRNRLWQMRNAATSEPGSGLVLRGRMDRVVARYNEMFPPPPPLSDEERAALKAAADKLPKTKAPKVRYRKENQAGAARGYAAGKAANLSGGRNATHGGTSTKAVR